MCLSSTVDHGHEFLRDIADVFNSSQTEIDDVIFIVVALVGLTEGADKSLAQRGTVVDLD